MPDCPQAQAPLDVSNSHFEVAQASSPASSAGVPPGVHPGGETPPELAAGTATLGSQNENCWLDVAHASLRAGCAAFLPRVATAYLGEKRMLRHRRARMQALQTALGIVALLLTTWQASAADQPIKHRLMFFEYGKGPNRLIELDENGKVVWEHKPPSIAVIFEVLPNGNVLYAYGGKPTGVREVTRKDEEVWNYVTQCPQVLGCRRLPNGNTLLAEQGPCRAVEVNPKGEVVRVTPLKTSHEGYHLQVRNVHKLSNGNILAAHEGEGAVREVDLDGNVVWEYTGVENAGDAQRLANGNTLISCGTQKRVIEVTPEKKIAWEFSAKDAPELNITWVSSIQLLKNGNLIIGNFLRGQEAKGAHVFEVTREKKVVWKWADHDLIKSLTTVRVLGE